MNHQNKRQKLYFRAFDKTMPNTIHYTNGPLNSGYHGYHIDNIPVKDARMLYEPLSNRSSAINISSGLSPLRSTSSVQSSNQPLLPRVSPPSKSPPLGLPSNQTLLPASSRISPLSKTALYSPSSVFSANISPTSSVNDTQKIFVQKKCFQCGLPASLMCSLCKNTWYCCKQCQVNIA